jgi:hypothetical protein
VSFREQILARRSSFSRIPSKKVRRVAWQLVTLRPRVVRWKTRLVVTRLLRPVVVWLFNRRAVAKLTRRAHVLCLGDSNVLILRQLRLPGVWLQRYGLGGATAGRIPNPVPDALSSEGFDERLSRARPWQQVLYMLGGVDCSFVIWHHAREHGLEVETVFQEMVDAYGQRIQQTIEMGFKRVLIVTPPLPTMGDEQRTRGLRGQVTGTHRQRTELTLRFKVEMERRCQELGAVFVDVTSEQLDPETGLIASRFVREGRNHHLKEEPYREIVARRLAALDW